MTIEELIDILSEYNKDEIVFIITPHYKNLVIATDVISVNDKNVCITTEII